MARLKTYQDFYSKGASFDQYLINTKAELDDIFTYYKRRNDVDKYIFRGCNDSRFKLYNSAQRKWAQLELDKWKIPYSRIIETEIKNAKKWQNGLLEKFFSAFGQPAYEISILSFLQHYGAPTPLLDWTYSFENALFFATDKMKYSESDSDLENYISVYSIEIKEIEEVNLLDKFSAAISEIGYLLSRDVEFSRDSAKTYEFTYGYLNGFDVAYIPGYRSGGFAFQLKRRPSFNIVYNQQNLNIINQKGLFVFNNTPDKPLEFFFGGKNSDFGVTLPKIKCYNIHKSLHDYICYRLTHDTRGYRRSNPIDHEFIYPQEELIATKAFNNFLNFNH